MTWIVVHYYEIALKGKNRGLFEQRLKDNIKSKLGDLIVSCIREPGQLTIEVADKKKCGTSKGFTVTNSRHRLFLCRRKD